MDTFVDSSWYFYRYCDPHNSTAPFDSKKIAYWFPIDQYIGGIEHAILHLIYSRFWTKVMRDLGLIANSEPATRMFTQGMVIKDGAKMSKSRGNVVSPDDMVEQVRRRYRPGLRALRRAARKGNGLDRLRRQRRLRVPFARLSIRHPQRRQRRRQRPAKPTAKSCASSTRPCRNHRRFREPLALQHLHRSVDGIDEHSHIDREADLRRSHARSSRKTRLSCWNPSRLTSPKNCGKSRAAQGPVFNHPWPDYDPELAREDEAEVVIQVNGKLRGRIYVAVRHAARNARETGARRRESQIAHWTVSKL